MLRSRFLVCAALALLGAAAAPAAGAAGVDVVTVVERHVDVNPGETNPCTGASGTIVDDEQDTFHVTSLADGRLQLAGHSTVDVAFVPDDPDGVRYAGHETFNFAATGGGATLATTLTTYVRVRGTDGSFFTLREIAHLTVSRGDVVVAFDRPTLGCSGIAEPIRP
jgi:hypothetical protein